MRALLIYPSHENCREVHTDFLAAGIDAVPYPPRLTTSTDHFAQNCVNELADQAEQVGFAVVQAVCPTCESRGACFESGYLAQLAQAERATVALCTHARAEYAGLGGLTKSRRYVSIHENPIDILRPRVCASRTGLRKVQFVLRWMLNDSEFLKWFRDAVRIDIDGDFYRDEEQAVRRDRQYRFCLHLAEIVDDVLHALTAARSTCEWTPRAHQARPSGIERTLFRATQESGSPGGAMPWRFLLAAAAGELKSAAIVVDETIQSKPLSGKPENDAAERPVTEEESDRRQVVGFRHNPPSPATTTWFNDATINAERLARILGRPVEDKTPGGRIALQKKAVQIPRDITRGTSEESFRKIVRGVLTDRPQFPRVGLICHQPHLAAAEALEPEFARRIVKTAYFGSGEERSSNAWHQECDLILVAGTPRVQPRAIQQYLLQVGEISAACRPGRWGTLPWDGRTESGEPVRITARGYVDDDWRSAHRDLVRAALVQAIGRGRGILADGCEVIVLSTEECGLPLSDAGMQTLNTSSVRVLTALQELGAENPKKHLIGKTAHKTAAIATRVGLSVRQTQEILAALEQRGLVQKCGERGGWRIVLPESSENPVPATVADSVPGA